MDQFGWGDPVEKSIIIQYRRKGRKEEHGFGGPVAVVGQDRKSLTWLKREDLPLRNGRLDLTRVPVVGIGGKRRHQPGRAQRFLEDNPSFQGALLLYPGSGNWDLGEGMLFVTSREVLSGQRISGGRPKVELVHFRWLRDGRYVADRARTLHGKILETLEAELEQEPGPDEMVRAVLGGSFPHRLYRVRNKVASELSELERKRVMLLDEDARDMYALVRESLVAKIKASGARFVRDIPEDVTVTTEEIAPELVAARDGLGLILIPGLGMRPIEMRRAYRGWQSEEVPTVSLGVEELCELQAWTHDEVLPFMPELGDSDRQLNALRHVLELPEDERMAAVREALRGQWADAQKRQHHPEDEDVADPRVEDPPETPVPVTWGFDLVTGEDLVAHAALDRTGYDGESWKIRWFEDAEHARKADREARAEARSRMAARHLESELTTDVVDVELPRALPEPFEPFVPGPADAMSALGFADDAFRVEGTGPRNIVASPERSYWSEVKQREIVIRATSYKWAWHRVDEENGQIVAFSNATSGQILDEAEDLGCSPEQVQAARQGLERQKERSCQEYRGKVSAFIRDLKARPAYSALSLKAADRLEELAGREWGTDAPDAEALRKEWSRAVAIHRKVEQGLCLANFGGHFRVMGRTGQAQYWVIRPDGAERNPDRINCRKRYTSEGSKRWSLVGPGELAISWFKDNTSANHQFVVDKLPVDGCTPAQLRRVRRLEDQIGERFEGATGMSGKESPGVGLGWGLVDRVQPEPAPTAFQAALQARIEAVPSPVAPAADQPATAPTFVLDDPKRRSFKCGCGRFAKATKSDMRSFNAGTAITLICVVCGDGVAEPDGGSAKKAGEDKASSVSMADLLGKWGKRR